jgi:hypothetical protein
LGCTELEESLRLLEKGFLLKANFFVDLAQHVARLFVLVLRELVGTLQVVLGVLLSCKSLFGSLILFLRCIKALHALSEDLIKGRNVNAFVRELSGEGRELISQDGYFTLKVVALLLKLSQALTDLSELALLTADVILKLLVVLLLSVELLLVVFQIRLLLVEELLGATVLLTSLVDQLISLSAVVNSVLPLEVQLVTLGMESLELFGGLVELNLGSLSLSNLLFELFGLARHLNGQLLNVEGELLDLGLISTPVLLEGQVVLLLLSCGEGPLLELLLIPVHLQFELVHLLVGLENHVLDVVQAVLLVGHSLLKLLNLILQTPTLSLSNLLQVLL